MSKHLDLSDGRWPRGHMKARFSLVAWSHDSRSLKVWNNLESVGELCPNRAVHCSTFAHQFSVKLAADEEMVVVKEIKQKVHIKDVRVVCHPRKRTDIIWSTEMNKNRKTESASRWHKVRQPKERVRSWMLNEWLDDSRSKYDVECAPSPKRSI